MSHNTSQKSFYIDKKNMRGGREEKERKEGRRKKKKRVAAEEFDRASKSDPVTEFCA